MKNILPKWLKQLLKQLISFVQYNFFMLRSEFNAIFLEGLIKKYKKIHLGCGDIRLKDFINIDYRATKATDIAKDCSKLDFLPDRSIELVYSSAFIEHLYLSQRQECINEIYRVLNDRGKTIVLSIPDFEEIAKAYLNKQKINKGKIFDLYEVYRFTHGEPEQAPGWWLQQLHKSLFDTKSLASLFKNAGFSYFVIFRSSYGDELSAVNLGIIAYKKRPNNEKVNSKTIAEIFERFKVSLNPKTISIVYDSLKQKN